MSVKDASPASPSLGSGRIEKNQVLIGLGDFFGYIQLFVAALERDKELSSGHCFIVIVASLPGFRLRNSDCSAWRCPTLGALSLAADAFGYPHTQLGLVGYRLCSSDMFRRFDLFRLKPNRDWRLGARMALADLCR